MVVASPWAIRAGALGGGQGLANLITNGDFTAGKSGWVYFDSPEGAGEHRVSDGVFEWNRPGDASTQSVVFQNTGATVSGASLQAQFDLGNSAPIRQRVTVLVIDADFSDLAVCTFWLDSGASMRTYQMRTHTRKPWANAAIYFLAATTNSARTNGGYLRLDNVSLAYNTIANERGTDCDDPLSPEPVSGAPLASPRETQEFARLNFDDVLSNEWASGVDGSGTRLLRWKRPIDVDAGSRSKLTFVSSVEGGAGSAEVQASLDGFNWRTIARIPPEEAWTDVQVDLSEYTGHRVYVQFAYTPLLGEKAVWHVRSLRITSRD
jgi:hypothetical protein